MRRLTIGLPALALALILTLSGSTTIPAASKASTAAPTPKKDAHFQYAYYWYTYPGDSFFDYQGLTVEEIEWLLFFGKLVNTNSGGGTLVARGYLINTYPHTTLPDILLYSH